MLGCMEDVWQRREHVMLGCMENCGHVSPPFHSTPTSRRIRKIAQEMELMADSLSESISESDDSESVLLEDSLSAAAHEMSDSSIGSEGDVAQKRMCSLSPRIQNHQPLMSDDVMFFSVRWSHQFQHLA